jgi:nucleoid-associated protein YgaU
MKSISRIAAAIVILLVVAIADVPYLSRTLVPDAQAFRGRGAAFAVGAAAGSASASSAEAEAAAAQQQAAAAQKQAAEAEKQLAAEKEKTAAAQAQAAPTPVASGKPLPLGTVVAALPAGCTATPVDGVNYYYCGGNFYKAAYEGSTLKYVTTKPK